MKFRAIPHARARSVVSNQLRGSTFRGGLPPNAGARLLVIDRFVGGLGSGGKAPLSRLSPASVRGFFCACFRKSETKCPASSPVRSLHQSDFRHSNQSLGVTFCSWLAVYAEASVDPA